MSERRGHGDAGGSLILMPVGVLVVLLLGAIAFDLSWTYVAQRELVDAAASAANDAVTVGLDPSSLRDGSGGRIDPGRAARAVDASLRLHHLSGLDPGGTSVVVTGQRVTVSLRRHVDYVFARGIPAWQAGTDVTTTVSADVLQR